MHRRSLLKAAAILPWPMGASADVDPQAGDLIDAIIRAHGGATAWRGLQSLNAEGDIIAVMRGERGRYQRWMARDRKLRVETHYANSDETRILNGSRSWRTTAGSMMLPVTGIGQLAMVYQYKQLDLPYGLLQKLYTVRILGHEPLDGVACMVLQLSDSEGPTMRVHVDESNQRIVQVTGLISVGAASTSLSARFADYQLVEGINLPMRINNFSGNAPISETHIQRYALNPTTEPARFEPPAATGQSA